MNERYQKNSLPEGKTRKSAAAAKPKRATSSGSTPVKSSSASKATGATKKRQPLVLHPDTPQYKYWRRIWWAFLGTAIVLSTVSWFVMKEGAAQRQLGTWILGAAYGAIAAALFIDWTKLRKIRAAWLAEQKSSHSKS